MGGCVVHGKAVPDIAAELLAEQISQRMATVNVEIVHHDVNGPWGWVLERQLDRNLGELSPFQPALSVAMADLSWLKAPGATNVATRRDEQQFRR